MLESLICLTPYDAKRQETMRAALEQLKGLENLSGDLYEKITKALSELKSASSKYLIGVNIKGPSPDYDYKISHPGDVARSTSEVNKFIKACDIKL